MKYVNELQQSFKGKLYDETKQLVNLNDIDNIYKAVFKAISRFLKLKYKESSDKRIELKIITKNGYELDALTKPDEKVNYIMYLSTKDNLCEVDAINRKYIKSYGISSSEYISIIKSTLVTSGIYNINDIFASKITGVAVESLMECLNNHIKSRSYAEFSVEDAFTAIVAEDENGIFCKSINFNFKKEKDIWDYTVDEVKELAKQKGKVLIERQDGKEYTKLKVKIGNKVIKLVEIKDDEFEEDKDFNF